MREALHLSPPVAAGVTLQVLELVATNPTGHAVPFTGVSGQTFLGGYSTAVTNNVGGVDGAAFASVTIGTEHLKIAAGIQPKPGEHAYVVNSTTVTNVAPVLDADAKFVGTFVQPREFVSDEWLIDTRPAYFRRRPTAA